MSRETKSISGGLGFMSVLQLIFIVLKLTEVGAVAKWSWWWVISPTWGGIAFVVSLIVLYFIFHKPINRYLERAAERRFKRKVEEIKKNFKPGESIFEQRLKKMAEERRPKNADNSCVRPCGDNHCDTNGCVKRDRAATNEKGDK